MAVGDLLGSETAVATSGNTTINISVSPTITVAVGDLIFVAAGQLTNLEMTPNAVSDNMGNTYSSAGTPGDAGSATIAGYYSIVQTAGSLTSVSVAGKTTNANDYAIVMCVYAGSFSAADKLVATASDNATPFACPSTGVLSQANELVIGYGAGSATTSFGALSASAPMTMNAQDAFGSAASIRTAVASKIVSATTATAPAFTGTASGTINGQWGTATFKIGAIHAVTGAETAASSEAETAILTAVGASTESIATSETEDGIKFNPTRIFGGYNFLNTDAVNWAGLTLRVRFEPSMLAANNGGNERVTFEFLAGTSGVIAAAYIGHAAASGDAYDSDGFTQLTFFGGNTSWSVSGASSITSDYATGFNYDPTRALIISVAFTGTTIYLAGY